MRLVRKSASKRRRALPSQIQNRRIWANEQKASKKLKAPRATQKYIAASIAGMITTLVPIAMTHAYSLQDQVDKALNSYIGTIAGSSGDKRVEGTWQKLDTRLTLPVCPQDLAVAPLAERTTGRTTVRISCASPSWNLLVPVIIRTFLPVVVSNAPIERNEAVTPAALSVVEREIKPTLTGFFTDPAQVKGRLAKRPIPADQILTASMLKSPDVVGKGQTVIIEAASGSFAVRSAGTALTNGGLGDTIKVRNEQSGRIVEGVVVSEGKIRVAL